MRVCTVSDNGAYARLPARPCVIAVTVIVYVLLLTSPPLRPRCYYPNFTIIVRIATSRPITGGRYNDGSRTTVKPNNYYSRAVFYASRFPTPLPTPPPQSFFFTGLFNPVACTPPTTRGNPFLRPAHPPPASCAECAMRRFSFFLSAHLSVCIRFKGENSFGGQFTRRVNTLHRVD